MFVLTRCPPCRKPTTTTFLCSAAARAANTWHGTWPARGSAVAVVERKLIDGACPNTNCLPSKNEIWSAKVAYLVRRAEQFGTITGPARG